MRNIDSRPLLLLALLAPLVCGGCITDPLGRQNALKESQRSYTKAVRWGEIKEASGFVDPDLRSEFLRYAPAFEAIRITEFDIGEFSFQKDTMTVEVTYRAYSLASFVEHEVTERQEWYRPHLNNTWHVRPTLEGIFEPFAGAQR